MITTTHKIWIAVCLLLLGSTGARALDDGGGRSVFARGAGERALALGGTYVAVADDPTAVIWNPAGLATLDRTAFYASSTNLIGLGFSERLGVAALPSWKLGTIGLSFRHFGVDGIEQRDDRGTLGDPDLSDSENEIMLGYGRSFGTAWQLGIAAKYQQQDFAGYNDGALGLDAGLLFQPLRAMGLTSALARNLNLGLAVRNVLEPTMRLDSDSVADPTGVRCGTALTTVLGKNASLLLTADLDKTSGMDNRLHAGAELTLLNTLALRCGTGDGMFTAGAGLRYDGLKFDYAYEDNILGDVHRFGLGMAFGRTTTEKRQEELQTREAAFQKRLAAMFEQQNNSRNTALLDQLRQALSRGAYLNAQDRISTLRVLDPGQPDLDELEAQAFLLQARHQRNKGDLTGAVVAYQHSLGLDPELETAQAELQAVRDMSDRQAARSEELRRLLDEALAHYATGDFLAARKGFRDILELEPQDADARSFLASTQRSIDLQCETLADRALASAQAGNFRAARTDLDQARKLVADNPHLIETAHNIELLRNRSEADRGTAGSPDHRTTTQSPSPTPALPMSYADLPVKRQAEIGRLYRAGVNAMEEERRDDAVRYWELVWSSAADYQQVAENLKQEYLVQGMEAFAAGQLDLAITTWEKALNVAPEDARTKGYLARAYDHRSRIKRLKADEK